MPEAGNVTIQATTMLAAMFQRTADTFRAAPTRMIEPATVCVVDTGMPKYVAAKSMMAPPAEAQQPCTGVNRVILDPTVRTIRQPPIKVPRPIAARQVMTTQNGT